MGRIPGDHPCGNFLIISLRKFRGNEGEFSIWIFPPPFPVESLGIFSPGNFLPSFLWWHRKGPSYVKIFQCWFEVILWSIKMDAGLRKLPSHFNRDLKFPLNFRVDSRFTYNPNFRGFLHHQPPSPGIPRKIRENLPAGFIVVRLSR